jgi:hypothetical protein
MKRGNENSQVRREDYERDDDDDGDTGGSGTFQQADNETLKKRKLVRIKR